MSTAAPAAKLLTLPEVATSVGVTLYRLQRLVAQRPELAARLLRAGSRRMLLADDLPHVRLAIAEDRRR